MAAKICVIIPAYNASKTVHEVITGVLRYCPDVIVADDGSDDGTSAVVSETGVQLIKIEQNRGKGNALRELFRAAAEQGYDAVISIDADGQHDPASIPLFIEAYQKNPGRIIVGSRMAEKERIPKARLNSMQLANFYSSLAANQFLEDTQCGFRLYPLSLIGEMELTTEKYATETEILIKAGDRGSQIVFINIKAIYGSSESHFRAVKDVTLITSYVISYLTIKWLIEGVSSDRPNTYTRNNLIDKISRDPFLRNAFKVITVFTALPITVLFQLEYTLLAPFMNNFASIRKLGCGYFKITQATFMLPVVLVVLIINNTVKALGFQPDMIDRFVQRFYPELKEIINK